MTIAKQLCIAALLVTTFLAGPARADVGYTPPVNLHLRFENLDDFPKYDFYLKYGIGHGSPFPGVSFKLMKVESSGLFRIEGEGRRLTEVYLLAVPRGQRIEPAQPRTYTTQWLNERPENTLRSPPLSWKQREKLENHPSSTATYRIGIDGKQLSATWVEGHEPLIERGQWCWLASGGIVLSGVVASIGLIVILRRRRSSNQAMLHPPPDDSDEK